VILKQQIDVQQLILKQQINIQLLIFEAAD
jgi:hypothetical protein